MDEKRRHRRATPSGRVAVIDAMTGAELGTLGNLSATGLMLIAHAPVDEGLLFQLRFHVDGEGACGRDLSIGAESLWCAPANQAGRFFAGFEMVEIDEADQAFLADFADE